MADTLGKYELLKILGKGAMGVVYEGYDPIIARRLAIKTVKLPDPEDTEALGELARFKREAQASGRLSHPNIVGVFDYGETPEIAYIVMEFVDGTTLKHIIDKKERFELAEIVRIMTGLLTGLQYSHERGVVHRDIKPANIMLTQSGEVKIADFGIARIESSSMTQAGTMMGTPSYMSPEQFMGQTVDARTDLYSAGVMLYQLLTGEKPFDGGLTALMHKVLNTEPPPPSALSVTVPQAFDAVVRRAMAKRPQDRFATAGEFAKALREAFENKPAAGSPVENFEDSDATLIVDATMVAPSRATMPATPLPNAAATIAAQPAIASEATFIAAPAPVKSGPNFALLGGGVAILLALLGGGAFFLLKPAATPATGTSTATAITPVPAQAAPMSQSQREATLANTLGAQPCTLLSGTDNGTSTTISGIAGAGAPQAALNAAFASLPSNIAPASTVQTIDGPYCNELDAIRPYRTLYIDPNMALGLSLAGGKTTLHNGDIITVHNHMPKFSGYLETDYYSSDGTVLHLYPTPTDPQKHLPAGGAKTLGDPTTGGATWQISAPYGTDLIVSIASSSPLFSTPRPQDENASDYLPALRAALQNAADSNQSVAVSAIPVVTEP